MFCRQNIIVLCVQYREEVVLYVCISVCQATRCAVTSVQGDVIAALGCGLDALASFSGLEGSAVSPVKKPMKAESKDVYAFLFPSPGPGGRFAL